MKGPLLSELTTEDYTVHREGEAPPLGIALEVDAAGRPRAASGPGGAVALHVVREAVSLAEFLRDGELCLRVFRRLLLVVLVDGSGQVKGVVSPDRLEAALLHRGGFRGDTEVYGPDDGRAEPSEVRCENCSCVDQYLDVEPGVTPCLHCGGILKRP